jgi:hypothetical protein
MTERHLSMQELGSECWMHPLRKIYSQAKCNCKTIRKKITKEREKPAKVWRGSKTGSTSEMYSGKPIYNEDEQPVSHN